MTLPHHKFIDDLYIIRSAVGRIARRGTIEQTIIAIEELDRVRKQLDRVQANPHLWVERAEAMSDKYQGSEEKLLLSGVNDVHLVHDQATYTPDPVPAAHDDRRDGLPAGDSPAR